MSVPVARPLIVCAASLVLLAVAGLPGALGAPPNEAGWEQQWGMRLIGAEAAWDRGLRGVGVDIAIIDTGIHLTHQEFSGRIGPGTNYIDPSSPPQDDSRDPYGSPSGHGTHVAGIAAAGVGNGGVAGVAPGATIMPIKVLDEDGDGTASDVAAAIHWATDNGAEVINLSLGETDQSLFGPSTQDAIKYAWGKGVICVFAAGNSFVLPSGFQDEPAIVVAAVSSNKTKSYFSSSVANAMWALAAPGGPASLTAPAEEEIFSTAWNGDGRDDMYRYMQGTSQAAPHVAGAAALLRGAGLSPQATVDRLLATAEDLGPSGRDGTYGSGLLDVAAATDGLGAAPETTQPPDPSPTTSPPVPAPSTPPTTERRAPPTSAPAEQPEETSTTTASPAPDDSTTTSRPQTTDGTVVIGEPPDGEGGGRPWVLIGLAGAFLATTAAGAIVARRLAAPPPPA